jgi:hypothetical protein
LQLRIAEESMELQHNTSPADDKELTGLALAQCRVGELRFAPTTSETVLREVASSPSLET